MHKIMVWILMNVNNSIIGDYKIMELKKKKKEYASKESILSFYL